MSVHVSLTPATPALLGFVAVLAVTVRTASARGIPPADAGRAGSRGKGRRICGGLFALAAFLFIPPGSIPPLYDTDWGGAASVGLLGTGLVFFRAAGRGCGRPCRPVSPLFFAWAVLAAAGAVSAGYAEHRGMPGALLSLGTFASFPLWEITGSWGKAGLACFLSALALGGADLRLSAAESLAGQIWGLCRAAVVVCLFLPWSPADHVSGDSFLVPAVDFCLFWLKTVLFFLAASLLPRRVGIVSRPFLCLAGAAGMYADLVFGAPPPLPLFP